VDGAVWGVIGTLVGAAVGALASIATTVIANRNMARLQVQADSLERTERFRAFQRKTLLAVQDALQSVARHARRAHHETLLAHRRGAPWGEVLLSEDVDEEARLANGRLSSLIERVADDSLRSELIEVHSALTRSILCRSKEEADALVNDAADRVVAVMSKLGETLRSYY